MNTQRKLKSYKDLLVWQKSMALVKDIYRLTRSFPEDERFGLVSQLGRAAVSVLSNIAPQDSRVTSRDGFMPSPGWHHQGGKLFHPSKGSCEKIGRASLLASRHLSKSLPHEARREPRPPDFFTPSLDINHIMARSQPDPAIASFYSSAFQELP